MSKRIGVSDDSHHLPGISLSLTATLRSGDCYCSYFIEEEAEAQRGWPTCPGSHISVTLEHEAGTVLRGGWGDQALRVLGVGPRSLDLISMLTYSPF